MDTSVNLGLIDIAKDYIENMLLETPGRKSLVMD
jgi:hypothetical protein